MEVEEVRAFVSSTRSMYLVHIGAGASNKSVSIDKYAGRAKSSMIDMVTPRSERLCELTDVC